MNKQLESFTCSVTEITRTCYIQCYLERQEGYFLKLNVSRSQPWKALEWTGSGVRNRKCKVAKVRTSSVCLRKQREPIPMCIDLIELRVSGRYHFCNFDIAHSDNCHILLLRSIFTSLLTQIQNLFDLTSTEVLETILAQCSGNHILDS